MQSHEKSEGKFRETMAEEKDEAEEVGKLPQAILWERLLGDLQQYFTPIHCTQVLNTIYTILLVVCLWRVRMCVWYSIVTH